MGMFIGRKVSRQAIDDQMKFVANTRLWESFEYQQLRRQLSHPSTTASEARDWLLRARPGRRHYLVHSSLNPAAT
jgi:hypothetical protein